MNEALRLGSLALYASGPVVALLALRRRGFRPSAALDRVRDWTSFIPTILLPVEWLLPPVLLALGVGEVHAGWLPVRLVGFAVGLGGGVLLVWSSVLLGRFLVHEAAILPAHVLVTGGPYRFVRHPIYSGYLGLLLGTGVATLNLWLLLLWPVSLLGILIQARSEEKLLAATFGQEHDRYAGSTGLLVPRFWRRAD